MFAEVTPQLNQDVEAVLDAALRHSGLAALQAVSRIMLALNSARPMCEPVVE